MKLPAGVKDYAALYDSFEWPLSPAPTFMTLKIFLDDKSFHSLKQSIPAGSRSKVLLEEAIRLRFFGSNAVITCTEAEARSLLLYAEHCPGVIASVHQAFRSAGLPLEGTND